MNWVIRYIVSYARPVMVGIAVETRCNKGDIGLETAMVPLSLDAFDETVTQNFGLSPKLNWRKTLGTLGSIWQQSKH